MAIHVTARRSTLLRTILTSCVCCAGLGAAAGSIAQAEVLVTGPSPFAGCDVTNQTGINYPNAEVEPWVDVNPANAGNLIAGWQQDRFSDGGAKSLMSGYSNDGGATWTPVVVPGINVCSGGAGAFAFDRSSDPWVTIAPNGTAYFQSLSFNNDEPCGAGGDNALLVSKSTDGGATWSSPQVQILDTDGQLFNDKNSMRADPTDITSRRAFAVWDRLQDFTSPSSCTAARSAGVARSSHDGVAEARDRYRKADAGGPINKATFFTGPTLFTRTVDGGTTWEEPRIIFDPGSNAQTINNLIEVLPNGTVIDFFTNLSTLGFGGVKLGLVKSTDHGATFGPATNALKMVVTKNGTLTPDAQSPVRDANILFDVATDRGNGNLYVVWQDGRSRNIDKVAFSMSTNGGVTWSTPVIIDKTPYSPNKLRNQAFIPSVEVGANHRVVVTYYNFENDVNDGRELTDFWSISCDIANGDNCRTAGGWSGEQRLTSASFDILDAPVARGHFLGDYMGLVNAGGTVKSVFGKSVGVNLNDMFATSVP